MKLLFFFSFFILSFSLCFPSLSKTGTALFLVIQENRSYNGGGVWSVQLSSLPPIFIEMGVFLTRYLDRRMGEFVESST